MDRAWAARNRTGGLPFATLNGDRSRVGGGWGRGRVTRSLATGESENDYQDGNCWRVIVPTTVVVRGSTPIPRPPGSASRDEGPDDSRSRLGWR